MLVNTGLFIVGLVLLVKGSDFFVKSASSIAKKLGVSEFVIGLTLVAVGTSIPELVSSVMASIKQQSGIVIGNVVGSNIANIGLIVGLVAVIAIIKTREEMLRRDGYIMLFAALLFYVFIFNKMISRIEAVIFLLMYMGYMVFLFKAKPKFKGKYHFREFIGHFLKLRYLIVIRGGISPHKREKRVTPSTKRKVKELPKKGVIRDLLILIASGFAIVFGANYLIDGAIFYADFFNVPNTIIGVSLVAIGTSLPELSVSVSAARKGFGNIAIGNIIGSNIANIFLILGVSALIFPLSIIESTLVYTTPFMIFMTLLLLIFVKSQWELGRIEGIVLLILYIAFMSFLFYNSSLF